MTARDIRDNNPGNLRKNTTDKWQGLAVVQADTAFFTFTDITYGIRALALTLVAYQDRNGCETVFDFISRFAPPSDNNPTAAYAANVAAHIGIGTRAGCDVHKYEFMRPMVEAIITQESGADWSKSLTGAQLDKGLVLAGIQPPKKSLMLTPQVVGSAIAGAATVAQPIVQQVQEQLQPLTDYSDHIKHVFMGVALLGVLVAAIAKIDERRKGIS